MTHWPKTMRQPYLSQLAAKGSKKMDTVIFCPFRRRTRSWWLRTKAGCQNISSISKVIINITWFACLFCSQWPHARLLLNSCIKVVQKWPHVRQNCLCALVLKSAKLPTFSYSLVLLFLLAMSLRLAVPNTLHITVVHVPELGCYRCQETLHGSLLAHRVAI